MDLDELLMNSEEHMEKAIAYLKHEMQGVRTGRASPGLVEFVKVEAYGATSDLRQIAMVSAPEPSQLMVKPYDPSTTQSIIKGIQNAGLGLNPMSDGKVIRINIPALTSERRGQLANNVKHMGEQAKVAVRNARRDTNKELDAAAKDKSAHLSEDAVKQAKDEVQQLLKKYEAKIDELTAQKTAEIQQV
ncbi:MAG: ribosome recycling factor [Phycisphaeraceae bacterium]|nr:ribosome recycling factor [Phycisphaeraceae bacterium]